MNQRDLIIQSELKAVSFNSEKKLTKGQQALVKLLVDKAGKQEMLTRDDIAELYTTIEKRIYHKFIKYELVDHHPLDCRYGKEKHKVGKYETVVLTKDNIGNYYDTRQRAMNWFKSNLATCIIKGKILAIPIIEDM